MTIRPSLIDTNILVYAHDTSSSFYLRSREFLEEKLVEESAVYFSIQNYLEAFRIWTQKLKQPLPIDKAWDILRFYRQNAKLLMPSSSTLSIVSDITRKYKRRGVQVFDAQLVALMIENNIKTIYTANVKDFEMYREIHVENIFDER